MRYSIVYLWCIIIKRDCFVGKTAPPGSPANHAPVAVLNSVAESLQHVRVDHHWADDRTDNVAVAQMTQFRSHRLHQPERAEL